VPGEEISRHHAKLTVMPDGVAVEDLGSANGTFIAGKRVHQGTLKPGEELRLDTVRFLLVAPGMEVQSATKPAPAAPAPVAEPEKSGSAVWIVVGLLAVVGAAAAAWGLGLFG
jgi:pSer/pThr/pTyr-binding forkhead associated (FHA) protein